MEDVESERRISRRKRKLSTRQGVVIGVATVAGLGLMTKLLSFLRRETQPKKVKDDDIETLEAVLNGDAAKGALSPLTAEVHMFANLENDEPHHELLNGHDPSPPSSKDAHSDVTKKDEYVTLAEESLPFPVSQGEVNVEETPHSNGEEGEVKNSNEDAVEPLIEDEVEVDGEDAVTEQIHIEEKGEPHIEDAEQLATESGDALIKSHLEDAVELHTVAEGRQLTGDALEVLGEDAEKLNTEEGNVVEDAVELQGENEAQPHSEDAVEQLIEDAEKVEAKDEKYQEGAGELQTEGEGKLHSEEAEALES